MKFWSVVIFCYILLYIMWRQKHLKWKYNFYPDTYKSEISLVRRPHPLQHRFICYFFLWSSFYLHSVSSIELNRIVWYRKMKSISNSVKTNKGWDFLYFRLEIVHWIHKNIPTLQKKTLCCLSFLRWVFHFDLK